MNATGSTPVTVNVLRLFIRCEQKSLTILGCLFTGVKKGDRVAIYMPMIIEITVAMLACARIGAIHSIVVRSCFSFFLHNVNQGKWNYQY